MERKKKKKFWYLQKNTFKKQKNTQVKKEPYPFFLQKPTTKMHLYRLTKLLIFFISLLSFSCTSIFYPYFYILLLWQYRVPPQRGHFYPSGEYEFKGDFRREVCINVFKNFLLVTVIIFLLWRKPKLYFLKIWIWIFI